MKKCILNFSVTLILLVVSTASFGSEIRSQVKSPPVDNFTFFKKNKMKKINNMTHEKFDAITDSVIKIYSPVVLEKGRHLIIEKLWDEDEKIARTSQKNDNWIITLSGGMARQESLTDDAFLLIICHELGHHMGGAPIKTEGSSWSSVEGQADYFATMKCMRRILENDDNQKIVSNISIDPDVKEKCQTVYKSADDIALCTRISIAALSSANSVSIGEPLAFDTPAKYKASITFNDHSLSAQCRLDTFYSGILCDKSYDQETDMNNPLVGVCTLKDGHKLGLRPLCWYLPGENEI